MVIRVNKTNNYTVMSNYHLREHEMSLKAKGLLSFMLSLPDNWDYSINGLVAICKENETAIKSTLNELKDFGYLNVTKLMPNESKTGRIEYLYDIYEEPQTRDKKQEVENLGLENLHVGNHTQINTKEINTNNNIYIVQFEKFYEAYPKKQSKKDTEKWFIKHKPSEDQFNLMMNKLEEFKKCKQWQNKQYIPMPTTWLNQERWNDEIDDSQVENTTDWSRPDYKRSDITIVGL